MHIRRAGGYERNPHESSIVLSYLHLPCTKFNQTLVDCNSCSTRLPRLFRRSVLFRQLGRLRLASTPAWYFRPGPGLIYCGLGGLLKSLTATLRLGGINSTRIIGYFDAAHADNANRRSTCGYIFLLEGSPISWVTRVQQTVALSTMEAELMAGTEVTRGALWTHGLINEIYGPFLMNLGVTTKDPLP